MGASKNDNMHFSLSNGNSREGGSGGRRQINNSVTGSICAGQYLQQTRSTISDGGAINMVGLSYIHGAQGCAQQDQHKQSQPSGVRLTRHGEQGENQKKFKISLICAMGMESWSNHVQKPTVER